MLKIENLKKYLDKKLVIDDLNLEIKRGKVLAILGPNGSGKTTLLKLIAGLLKKNSGKILLNGKEDNLYMKNHISYLPDLDILDNDYKISEIINIYSDFFKDFNKEKAYSLIKELNLNINDKIKTLSKGNKEKVMLLLILSRNAELYILDEPIAGVDIKARKEILNLIIDNINKDSILIITTHLISDIEQIFDLVTFMNNGKLTEVYDVEKLRDEMNISVEDMYLKVFNEMEV